VKRKPKVVSIVLTWNAADFVCQALDSLQKSSFPTEILVIDNDSADATRDVVTANFPDVKLINTGENLGYAGGNNFGIEVALEENPDYIFILNPDAFVDANCLATLVQRMESERSVAAVSPIIYNAESRQPWFAGSWIRWRTGETVQISTIDAKQKYTERINGCAVLVRANAIQKTGLMDARYFLYYEESDWSVRFTARGYKNGLEPNAVAWHNVSSSTGGGLSPLYQYYMARNRLLFVKKHRPNFLPIVMFSSLHIAYHDIILISKRSGLANAIRCAKAMMRGQMDFFFGRFGRRF